MNLKENKDKIECSALSVNVLDLFLCWVQKIKK